MTRTPTYTPAFIRGWNAAMSHAEDTLVNLSLRATATPDVPDALKGECAFAGRLLMAAANTVGQNRQPTKRHYG